MTESEPSGRVAVYIDFDNVVISRYDQVFGRGDFMRDQARNFSMSRKSTEAVARKLDEARIDVGAILDYASSFGTLVLSRAYADWSAPANAGYQRQLVDRAVDLTQLFNVAGTKNGADIRLSVDVVDDLFRLDELTHVVIVAGDSDYIALAQRCRRLGRFVVGIGVTGSTSRALIAACDEFTRYDDVPGVVAPDPVRTAEARAPRGGGSSPTARTEPEPEPDPAAEVPVDDTLDAPLTQEAATELLVRALRLVDAKNDEDWQTNSGVKNQMMRINPGFKEKPLGYRSFTDFLNSRTDVIEVLPKAGPNERRLKLR